MDAPKVSRGGLVKFATDRKAAAVTVLVLVWLGLALRLHLLVNDPLHQDEALYSYWGRLISTAHDIWLARVPIDKPPLVPYLIAGSQITLGLSEFANRMPGLAASLVAVPLVYRLARSLYDDTLAALVTASVLALTPYPVLFGATAFTDTVLITWWLAACYAALSGHWGRAGLALGLAFATKQQALALAPLVFGFGVIGWQVASPDGKWRAQCARCVLGSVLVIGGVLAWDWFRVSGHAASSYWGQGIESYGGLRVISSPELSQRLRAWIRLGGFFFGWPWLSVLFLSGVGVLVGRVVFRRRRTRANAADLVIGGFAVFYLTLHTFVAFPVWDRYLLPLVPMMALLLGRTVSFLIQALPDWQDPSLLALRISRVAIFPLVLALLAASGVSAARGTIPVGGDHGAYDGLKDVVMYLRNQPAGTVLYDRWLSWHYDYYLYASYVYRAGFPTPAWLAEDLATFYDGEPRYVVVPSWESSARLIRSVREVGLSMSPVLTTYRRDGTSSFIVHVIATENVDTR